MSRIEVCLSAFSCRTGMKFGMSPTADDAPAGLSFLNMIVGEPVGPHGPLSQNPFVVSHLEGNYGGEGGFEPTEPMKAQRFSRPPDSTTLAPHRISSSV